MPQPTDIGVIAAVLNDSEDTILSFRYGDHVCSILHGISQRLFLEHVATEFERLDGNGGMCLRDGAVEHDVRLRLVQYRRQIGANQGAGEPILLRSGTGIGFDNVDQPYHLDIVHRLQRRQP